MICVAKKLNIPTHKLRRTTSQLSFSSAPNNPQNNVRHSRINWHSLHSQMPSKLFTFVYNYPPSTGSTVNVSTARITGKKYEFVCIASKSKGKRIHIQTHPSSPHAEKPKDKGLLNITYTLRKPNTHTDY